jgi:hypothetical protein
MDNTIKRLLLIYAVPICVISIVMAFIAPPIVSVALLTMLCSTVLLVIGVAFLFDHFDK